MIKSTINLDANVRIETEFKRCFLWKSDMNAGFGFPCDEEGNIEKNNLFPEALKNMEFCLADNGRKLIDQGVVTHEKRFRLCRCGSRKERFLLRDFYGISVGYCCQDCHDHLRAKYRPEVFDGPYESEDCPIEPEDY